MSLWCTGQVQCRMCDYKHVSVWPDDIVDEDRQECPNCGHMACEPAEDIIEGPFEVGDDMEKKRDDGSRMLGDEDE